MKNEGTEVFRQILKPSEMLEMKRHKDNSKSNKYFIDKGVTVVDAQTESW